MTKTGKKRTIDARPKMKKAGVGSSLQGGRLEVVSGKFFMTLTPTAATTPFGMYVSPQFPTAQATNWVQAIYGNDKMVAMSDLFQYFRYTSLKFKSLDVESNASTFGYTADSIQSFPSTFNEVAGLPFNGGLRYQVLPYKPENRGPSSQMMLKQNINWWRTRASGSVDDQFEYQGTWWFAKLGSTSTATNFEVSYTIEFKDFIGAAETPFLPIQMRTTPEAQQEVGDDTKHPEPKVPPREQASDAAAQAELRMTRKEEEYIRYIVGLMLKGRPLPGLSDWAGSRPESPVMVADVRKD